MGTHPIFESDFDCLTDRFGSKDKPWPKEEVEERRLSLPFKRTRPTSSDTRSSSEDDVKVKPTISPASVFVFKTRTTLPRSPTLASKVTLSSVLLTPMSCHDMVSLAVLPTTPPPTLPVSSSAVVSFKNSDWTHSMKVNSKLMVTNTMKKLMPTKSHHSDAIWILVLPEPQLVPVSSVS